MDKLFIEKTKSTPEINFDSVNNILQLTGASYPENTFEFFEKIYIWLEEYFSKLREEKVIFEFKLTYFNTSSTKSILNIINILEENYSYGKKIYIKWYYDEENEILYEIAEDFLSDVEIPYELIPTKS